MRTARLFNPLCWISIAALALAGCGAADAGPPPVAPKAEVPPAPTAAAKAAKADPPPAAQVFASEAPELEFRDPERRKKLALAFPKIDVIAEEELKAQGIPSVAVGVVIDGELAYTKGFGVADLKTNARPDADTAYRIGSITKSFTALTLLSLRDQGALSLDDTLARWIPEAAQLVYPTRDSPPVTLRQMLTHTSGLPRLGKFSYTQADRGPSVDEVVKSLIGYSVENAPGTIKEYSNLGYSLLGIVAGRAGRAPLREVMGKRLLAPLGMTSTVWDRAGVPPERLATAYAKGPGGELKPVDHWVLGDSEGSGGLYSTVRDMARYVALQLDAYPPRSAPESGPLKRSSVREAHFNALKESFQVRLGDAPRKGESLVDARASSYGYAWVSEQTCELEEIVWHNGGTDGYSTVIALLPKQGVGVIALANVATVQPEVIMKRALLALQKSGGLSKRIRKLPEAFKPAMKKFLAVYNTWSEDGYKAMLTPGRSVPMSDEKTELEGYKSLHGACKGSSLIRVNGPNDAVFKMDCERGALAMAVTLANDGLIAGFVGTSRDLPIPPDLRKVADRVVGLVKKWDEGVYKRHLAKVKRPRDAAVKLFDDLRAAHGACEVKSMINVGFDKKLVLECERGGDVTLALAIDPKSQDTVNAYMFRGVGGGTCPVR